jgi:hypothetical protein
MAGDLSIRAPEDRTKICMTEEWEIRYWTKELGVPKDRLVLVIAQVGNSAEDVRRELDK